MTSTLLLTQTLLLCGQKLRQLIRPGILRSARRSGKNKSAQENRFGFRARAAHF